MRVLPKSEAWAWDIETAIDGQIVDYPTMISCSNGENNFVAIGKENIRSLAVALRDSKSQLVTWNGHAFDEPVMKRWGIEMPMSHDGMVIAFFMDETQPRSLESCAVKYLQSPSWKHGDWKNFDPTSKEAADYGALDSWYTMQLYQLFRRELSKDKRLYLIENLIYPLRKVFDDLSLRGVYLDSKAVQDTRQEVVAQLESHTFDINPNSTKQVAAKLDELGLWYPLTEKGKPHVSKDILAAYQDTPFVAELLEYREQAKQLSTYIKPYEKLSQEGDGRAHPEYKMVSVDTGRTSATKPNVQNLDRKLKKFFAAAPGKVLLLVDYSAIEFRVASWLAQEETVLARFQENPNWDPHAFFAAMFYDKDEKDVTEAERQIAKSANFSQLYIGTGFTLWEYAKKQGVHIPLHLCERLHNMWHQTFPGFNRYYLATKKKILDTGQVQCPTGFIRHFGDPQLIRQNFGQTFFGKLRQAVNVPVQNLSTHIAFLAMKRLVDFNFPMVLFIHDSIGFELDDDGFSLDKKVKKIEEVMCTWPIKALKEEYDVDFTIPLTVKSEIKRN